MTTSTSSTSSTSFALSSSSGLASISGLSSGIDTSSLVTSLLQIEAQPQTRLKAKLTTNQAQTALLQSINTKLKALTESASKMSLGTTTSTMKATTSDATAMSASVTGTPVATSLTVKVNQVAKAASAEFTGAGTSAAGGWVAPTGTFSTHPVSVTANGKTTVLTAASYSIDDVASAVNSSSTGVTAAIISDGTNRHLVLTAETGDAPLFLALKDPSDSSAPSAASPTAGMLPARSFNAVTGADAMITVNEIAVTSSSNTFAEVIPGLSVTLAPNAKIWSSSDPTANVTTVTSSVDSAGASTAVKGVVDALAAVLADLKLATTAPASGTSASAADGGLFAGDSTLRGVYASLVSTVTGSTTGAGLAEAGIEANTSGTVSVDADKLTAYLTANPTLARTTLTNFGTQLSGAASVASITGSGTISSAIASLQSSATDMTSRISGWDNRLAIRQRTLTAQYTAMETALARLQSQTTALTSALKQLESDS